MMDGGVDYLERAGGAMVRGDFMGAIRYGVQAARATEAVRRCDAQILLALATLEMDLGEAALAYAVGAHLEASRVLDREREAKAAALLACVVARFPVLRMDGIAQFH